MTEQKVGPFRRRRRRDSRVQFGIQLGNSVPPFQRSSRNAHRGASSREIATLGVLGRAPLWHQVVLSICNR